MFENTVLIEISECERETAGGRRELHSEWLYDTCASPVLMTVIRSKVGGLCSTHGRMFGLKI